MLHTILTLNLCLYSMFQLTIVHLATLGIWKLAVVLPNCHIFKFLFLYMASSMWYGSNSSPMNTCFQIGCHVLNILLHFPYIASKRLINNLLYRNNLCVLSRVATEHVSKCNGHRKSLYLVTVGFSQFYCLLWQQNGKYFNVQFKLEVSSVCVNTEILWSTILHMKNSFLLFCGLPWMYMLEYNLK